MKHARFEVYEAKDGWRWRMLAPNNKTIATGEAHTRERDARRAVNTVIRHVLSRDKCQCRPFWIREEHAYREAMP